MKTRITLIAALVAIVLSACTEPDVTPASSIKNPIEKNSKVEHVKQ